MRKGGEIGFPQMEASRCFLLVVTFVFLSIGGSCTAQDVHIVNAEPRINLTLHIVKVYLALKVLLAFPPTQANHLALIKAQAAVGKQNKKTYVPLDVKPKELPDGPNGTKYFSNYQ